MNEDKIQIYFMNNSDIHSIAQKNPNYTKIYLKSQVDDNCIKLSLSKEATDKLYLVSSKEFSDTNSYFTLKQASDTINDKIEKSQLESKNDTVKRQKQQTLLSFFKK